MCDKFFCVVWGIKTPSNRCSFSFSFLFFFSARTSEYSVHDQQETNHKSHNHRLVLPCSEWASSAFKERTKISEACDMKRMAGTGGMTLHRDMGCWHLP